MTHEVDGAQVEEVSTLSAPELAALIAEQEAKNARLDARIEERQREIEKLRAQVEAHRSRQPPQERRRVDEEVRRLPASMTREQAFQAGVRAGQRDRVLRDLTFRKFLRSVRSFCAPRAIRGHTPRRVRVVCNGSASRDGPDEPEPPGLTALGPLVQRELFAALRRWAHQ